MQTARTARGFTLIEVMTALAIVAILSAIALPAYTSYVQRSRVPTALDALSALATHMELRFQEAGVYTCPDPLPTATDFTITCAVTSASQGFTATATGSGRVSGFRYTINQQGVRATTAHPNGVPATNCWSMRGSTCDT